VQKILVNGASSSAESAAKIQLQQYLKKTLVVLV